MGIRRLTYQDIPPALRAHKAAEAQKRLQSTLADPVSTPEQRAAAAHRQAVLRQWAAGTLPAQDPPLPTESAPEATPEQASELPAPEAHTVEVADSITVEES